MGPHTLFLADDYRENFKSIIRDLDLPQNPSLYVHAPSRLDPAKAPPGQDTLIAIVPVGHLDETGQQDWDSLRDQARQAVFDRLATIGITDLEAHLKFEVSYNPLSWRKRYNLMKGATHGLSHNLLQIGVLPPAQPPPALPQPVLRGRQHPSRHRRTDRPGLGPPGRRADYRRAGGGSWVVHWSGRRDWGSFTLQLATSE